MFVGGRRLASLAVGLAVALLAGCSGSSESPRTLPPLSTTPAASASTSPPQDPKAAAVAVVREYFRLINNLNHDMDADAFVAIMTPGCPCRAFARDIRNTAAKGQHYFGLVHVRSTTPAVDSPSHVEVLASYDSGHGGTADSSGHVLFRGPRRTGVTELFDMTASAGVWRIAQVQIIHKGHRR